jgi:hypothetical protein
MDAYHIISGGLALVLGCALGDIMYTLIENMKKNVSCCCEHEHECGEDPAVFRFMNGTSAYILNDEEKVLVMPDHVPVWITELLYIKNGPVTRAHTGGRLYAYVDVGNDSLDETMIQITGFYDEFERDMFKEFLEENL